MPALAYSDIGKQAKEVLNGGKIGIFQYDNKFTVNTKPENGLNVSFNALSATGKNTLVLQWKGTLKKPPVEIQFLQSAGKPKVTLTLSETLKANSPLDGVKGSIATTYPEPVKNSKATFEYAQANINCKAMLGLAPSANVDLFATAAYNGFTFGGQAKVLMNQQPQLDSYALAACFTGDNFVISGHTDAGFQSVRGTYWQQIDAANSVAAEVIHKQGDSAPPTLTLGYAYVDNAGTLTKFKVSQDKSLHLLREVKMDPCTNVAISACYNLYDGTAPKLGFAVEHNP